MFCTKNHSICHGVVSAEFFINHTFQQKCYIFIAHTGNFIMYAIGLFVELLSANVTCSTLLTLLVSPTAAYIDLGVTLCIFVRMHYLRRVWHYGNDCNTLVGMVIKWALCRRRVQFRIF